MPKVHEIASLQYLKKEGRNGVNFLHADIKLYYKLIPLILVGMASLVQIT